MKRQTFITCAFLGLVLFLAVGIAHALVFPITFSEFPVGTLVSNQYASLGVTFSAGTITPSLPIIANDAATPTSPTLSPNPPFNGDFFINFSPAVDFVTFTSGFWNSIGSGVIQAFDASHTLLSNQTNSATGIITSTFSGVGPISQIYFDSNPDPAGAVIDNLSTVVPEPSTLLLLSSGLLGLGGFAWKRRRG